jgi:thioredoxin-related protein
MKNSITLLIFLLLSTIGFSQQGVKWYTIQEAEKLNREAQRPIFIDTYTDWCGWCKKMDKDTFTDPVITEILNNKFYPVKFNAESKEDITVFGHTFVNDGKSGAAHQLAVELLGGQLSYPTVVFLIPQSDGKLQRQPVPGYRPAKDMETLLSYFSEKAYTTKSFDDFQKSFQGKVK